MNPYRAIGYIGDEPYDQFVDNKVTVPMGKAIYDPRTPTQAYMEELEANQALQDNTMDFAGGPIAGSLFRGASNAWSGIKFAKLLDKSSDAGMKATLSDVFAGQGIQAKNAILGTNTIRKKPTVRFANPTNKDSDGFTAFENPMVGSVPNIVIRKGLGRRLTGQAKRHEIGHVVDKYKNPELYTASDLVRTTGKKGTLKVREDWANKAPEFSAQSKELRYLESIVASKKRNPLEKATARYALQELHAQMSPFAKDFIQRFPKLSDDFLKTSDKIRIENYRRLGYIK